MENPIFIIGMPRSGTTVLSEAISNHENLGWISNYLNKTPFLTHISVLNRIVFAPTIGKYLRGKKNQDDKKKSMFLKILPYSVEAYRFWERTLGNKFSMDYLIGKYPSANEKKEILNKITIVLKSQGKKILFAKFTGPARINYLNSIFPGSKYIHIVRDPRAVVYSLLNEKKFWQKKGGLLEPWWKNGLTKKDVNQWNAYKRSPIALAAIQWRRVINVTWKEKKIINNENFIEIKYEDFVKYPHRTLSDIFKKLKLEDSEVAHEYIQSKSKVYNMNYKYKKNLSKKNIDIIEVITRNTAMKAGYSFN